MARNFVLETFVAALREGIEGYESFPDKHQANMAKLIWSGESKHRKHKGLDGYSSFSCRELEDLFGRGGFDGMNDYLQIFESTSFWSIEHSKTKGYKLTQKVKTIKDKYLNPDLDHISNVLYVDKKDKFKQLRALLDPVAARENDDPKAVSATRWKGAKVLNRTPVCIPSLMFLHKCLNEQLNDALREQDSFDEYEMACIARQIEATGKLIKHAQTTVAGHGYVAIRYAECESGRMYAKGESLQTKPRIVRQTALQGMYDYDIENCNFAIFEQMAARYGYQANAIRYYLENKNEVRHGIAERVGITIEQAKMCLLAILLGARMTLRPDNSIPQAVGTVKAELLYSDPQFKAIAENASKGRDVILDAWPKGRTTLMNDFGKRISLKKSPEKILAHLLQGAEAKAIRAAIDLYPNDIVLLMHDGFVSTREIDTGLVERKMLIETGYKFTLSGGKICHLDFPIFQSVEIAES